MVFIGRWNGLKREAEWSLQRSGVIFTERWSGLYRKWSGLFKEVEWSF